MDTFLRPKGLSAIDDEITRLAELLKTMDANGEEYTNVATNIKLLCEAREKKNDRVITAESLVAAAVSITSLLLVLNFERTGVITSKAFSFLRIGNRN